MAGRKKVTPHVSRDLRFDNRYLAACETDKKLIREWMSEENLTITAAARLAGVARGTLDKLLSDSPDWSKRTMAPKRSTMFLLEQAAGIEVKKWRPKRRKRKPRKPQAGIRKNRGYARRGGR